MERSHLPSIAGTQVRALDYHHRVAHTAAGPDVRKRRAAAYASTWREASY